MGSPFAAVATLNRRLVAPARLAIVMAIAAADTIDVTSLARVTGLDKGNVSHYLNELAGEGLVAVTRVIEGKRLRTRAQLTTAGEEALGVLWGTLDAARTVGGNDKIGSAATTGDATSEG